MSETAAQNVLLANAEAHRAAVLRGLRGAVDALNDAIAQKKRAVVDLSTLQKQLEDLAPQVLRQEENLKSLREEEAILKTRNEFSSDSLVKTISKRDSLREEIRTSGLRKEEIEAAIADLKVQKRAIESEIALLNEDAAETQKSCAALLVEKEELERDIEWLARRREASQVDHRRELADLNKDLDDARAAIAAENAKLGSADKAMLEREKNIEKQMRSIQVVQHRVDALFKKHFPGVTPPRL